MKKALFGLLALMIIGVLVGTVACASGQEAGPYVHTSGLNDGVAMTQTSAPTILAMPPATTAIVPAPTIPREYPPPVIITQVPAPEKGSVASGDISYATSYAVAADRMVIRTAYLIIVVDDVTATLQQINTLSETYGGFVVNSNISEERRRLFAYI